MARCWTLWDDLIAEASEAESARRALQAIVGWAYANATNFLGRHREDRDYSPISPPLGWAGSWDSEDSWEFLAFYPHRLKEVLTGMGFEPDPVLRVWRERGWLETDAVRGFTKRVRLGRFSSSLGEDRPRMVVITRAAIEGVTAEDDGG